MSTSVSWNGSSFTVPATGEEDWGGSSKVDGLLISLATNGLSKVGGTFALTAEVDFSSAFGLKSLYYKSRGSNVSTAGIIRLASAESVGWRNNANSGNLLLTTDASDNLLFDGSVIALATPGAADTVYTSDGVSVVFKTLTNANIDAAAAITRSKLATGTNYRILANTSAGVISENAALTAAHVVYADANGQLSGEATLSKSRGGAAADMSSVTFPSSGVIVTEAGNQVLTNKTLGGLSFATFTRGDLIAASSANTLSRVAIGASGTVLKSDGTDASWGSPASTLSYKAKTHADTGYTILNTDDFILWTLTNASNDTATLPSAAANAGKVYRIKLAATTAAFNTLTVSRAGSDTFTLADGTAAATTLVFYTAGEEYEFVSDGTSVWQVLNHRTAYSVTGLAHTFTGLGTVSAQFTASRRIGQYLTIEGTVKAGTTTGVAMKINLVTGLAIDSTVLTSTASVQGVGFLNRLAATTQSLAGANAGPFTVFYDGSDTASVYVAAHVGTVANTLDKDFGNSVLAANDACSFSFTVPISGWKS